MKMGYGSVKWTKPKHTGGCLRKGLGHACSTPFCLKIRFNGLTESRQVVLSSFNAGTAAGIHPAGKSRSVTLWGWHVYYGPWEWVRSKQKIKSADQDSTFRENRRGRLHVRMCVFVYVMRGVQLIVDRLNLCPTGGLCMSVWCFWSHPCTRPDLL